jgi:hypothetical protein
MLRWQTTKSQHNLFDCGQDPGFDPHQHGAESRKKEHRTSVRFPWMNEWAGLLSGTSLGATMGTGAGLLCLWWQIRRSDHTADLQTALNLLVAAAQGEPMAYLPLLVYAGAGTVIGVLFGGIFGWATRRT